MPLYKFNTYSLIDRNKHNFVKEMNTIVLINHSQSLLPVFSSVLGAEPQQPSHGSIFCQSLGLFFVWSLGDMQQSPLLFCFSQFALCSLKMGNRSKAEWMSCFARSPSLNGFQGWVSPGMCGWLWVCMRERERENFETALFAALTKST